MKRTLKKIKELSGRFIKRTWKSVKTNLKEKRESQDRGHRERY